jgi:NADH:ubiquinone oxidoreductase subunit 6 (subunit J)
MTMELFLFLTVSLVAVSAAILMLLSHNPVHSALFLIVNFFCVAFLYLMLNAPFLAMVQVAVYAGAIMVLFLFVIMLLGADKLAGPTSQYRWFAPLAGVLGLVFVLTVYWAITNGKIDLRGPGAGQPQLRVVHAVPDAGPVDVYANNQLIASNLNFRGTTDFKPVQPGAYTIALTQPGTQTAISGADVKLEFTPGKSSNNYTAIAYGGGSGGLQIALVADNLETTDNRTGRISVFNAFTGKDAVDLVDFGSDNDPNDTTVLASAIKSGDTIELPPQKENTLLRSWAFTDVGNPLVILARLNNPDIFNVKRDTAQLIVLFGETQFDGSLRAVATPLVNRATPSFGGPQSIGELLFTRYMLPFQLVAMLLLVAMIGAIVLTHKETEAAPRRRDQRRKVMRPLVDVIGQQTGQDVTVAAAPQLPEKQPEPSGD